MGFTDRSACDQYLNKKELTSSWHKPSTKTESAGEPKNELKADFKVKPKTEPFYRYLQIQGLKFLILHRFDVLTLDWRKFRRPFDIFFAGLSLRPFRIKPSTVCPHRSFELLSMRTNDEIIDLSA